MKVVILAGGYGTRLGEESETRPKPLVTIGDQPILWHIMKIYGAHGFNEFVVLLGYKGHQVKEYFSNYSLHHSNVEFDFKNNSTTLLNNQNEPWKITLVDTGLQTQTGGRLKNAKPFIGDDTFLLTYGDGLSNVDINDTVKFHQSHDGILTLTAVHRSGRFGAIGLTESGQVEHFTEKPVVDESWINGGFFVCDSEIFSYLPNENTVLEKEPIQSMAREKRVHAFMHAGFWECMDTPRDKTYLNELWQEGNAPWKIW